MAFWNAMVLSVLPSPTAPNSKMETLCGLGSSVGLEPHCPPSPLTLTALLNATSKSNATWKSVQKAKCNPLILRRYPTNSIVNHTEIQIQIQSQFNWHRNKWIISSLTKQFTSHTHTHQMTENLKENSNLKEECKFIRSNGMKFDPTESPIIDIDHLATCVTKQQQNKTQHLPIKHTLSYLKPNQRLKFENALLLINDTQIWNKTQSQKEKTTNTAKTKTNKPRKRTYKHLLESKLATGSDSKEDKKQVTKSKKKKKKERNCSRSREKRERKKKRGRRSSHWEQKQFCSSFVSIIISINLRTEKEKINSPFLHVTWWCIYRYLLTISFFFSNDSLCFPCIYWLIILIQI